MRGGLPFAAALAAIAGGKLGGASVLRDMFMPRFHHAPELPDGVIPHGKPGKHRHSGRGSPRPNDTTDWRHGTRAREAERHRKQAARNVDNSINHYYAERMRWNAEVLPRVLAARTRNERRPP